MWKAAGTHVLWSSPLASLTDSERRGTPRGTPKDARPVEFPLSLADSERRGTQCVTSVSVPSLHVAALPLLADCGTTSPQISDRQVEGKAISKKTQTYAAPANMEANQKEQSLKEEATAFKRKRNTSLMHVLLCILLRFHVL